jgi:hypothetical protein
MKLLLFEPMQKPEVLKLFLCIIRSNYFYIVLI